MDCDLKNIACRYRWKEVAIIMPGRCDQRKPQTRRRLLSHKPATTLHARQWLPMCARFRAAMWPFRRCLCADADPCWESGRSAAGNTPYAEPIRRRIFILLRIRFPNTGKTIAHRRRWVFIGRGLASANGAGYRQAGKIHPFSGRCRETVQRKQAIVCRREKGKPGRGRRQGFCERFSNF